MSDNILLRLSELSICGLKEIIATKSNIFRLIWSVVFAVGLGATGFWLFLTVQEYGENSRATKVFYETKRFYNYPKITLCPNNWLNSSRTTDYDLSTEALEFALNYIYYPDSHRFNENFLTAYIKTTSYPNKSDGKQEFNDFVTKHKTDNYLNFFALFFVDEKNIFDLEFSQFSNMSIDRRIITNFRGCYLISFPPIDATLMTKKVVPVVQLYFPELTGVTLLTTDNSFSHHALMINPDTEFIREINSEIYIESTKCYSITIRPKKIVNLNLNNRPCRESDDEFEYSANLCHSDCIQRNFFKPDGCMLFGHFVWSQNSSEPLCILKDMKEWDSERNKALNEVASMCSVHCVPSCVQYVYEEFITSRSLTEYELREGGFNRRNGTNMTIIRFDYDVSKGIFIFQEIETYTLETLICNVGGILGLWLGASVFTIIQLIVFPLEHIFTNCFR